jgi:hypothetical protein
LGIAEWIVRCPDEQLGNAEEDGHGPGNGQHETNQIQLQKMVIMKNGQKKTPKGMDGFMLPSDCPC